MSQLVRDGARLRRTAVAVALVAALAFAEDHTPGSSPGAPREEITEAALNAVQKGLAWLAKNQAANGSWTSSAPVATTSMCCLAFMGEGNTTCQGKYAENVRRGIEYLLRSVSASGFISEPSGRMMGGSGMHGHGFATLALAEALGTIADTDLYTRVEQGLKKAVRRIERSQNRYGGWNSTADPAMTDDGSGAVAIMQIMALRAARANGITIDADVIKKAKKYVIAMTTEDGWYQYNWNSRGSHRSCGLTGPGCYMLGALGEFDSPKYEKGIKNILASAPFLHGGNTGNDTGWQGWYYYALFYCSLAIFQHGGEAWGTFYPAMRDDLVHRQRSDGAWDDPYGGLYTAFALLSLELPYRTLPLFQEGGEGREGG